MENCPQPTGEKLARYLARCGVASRRKCEDLIRVGCVQVNSELVLTPETRITAPPDEVRVHDEIVHPPTHYRYILFNKPAGVLCTCNPSREIGKTVLEYVKVSERIFPVGRLDRDSCGLLLLTNDGEFMQRLTHPSFQKEKEYLVETTQTISEAMLERLRVGVALEDGFSKFLRFELLTNKQMRVVLGEGRKRQIRRTFKAVGLQVKRLERLRVAELRLGDLPVGAWRDLKLQEVEMLVGSQPNSL